VCVRIHIINIVQVYDLCVDKIGILVLYDYNIVSKIATSPVPIVDDDDVGVGLNVADDDVVGGDNEC
jgi:hypothetical protein